MHSLLGFEGEFSAAISKHSAYPIASYIVLSPCSGSSFCPHTACLLTSFYILLQSRPMLLIFLIFCHVSSQPCPDLYRAPLFTLTYFPALVLATFSSFPPNLSITDFSLFSSHLFCIRCNDKLMINQIKKNRDSSQLFSPLLPPNMDNNSYGELLEEKVRKRKAWKQHEYLLQSY